MSQSSSQRSLPDINLSQETMSRIIDAVGMGGSGGNVLTSCYYKDDVDGDGGLFDDDTVFGDCGPASISVRRGVFKGHSDCADQQMPWAESNFVPVVTSTSAPFGSKSPTPQPHQADTLLISPQVPSSSGRLEESPLVTPTNPTLCSTQVVSPMTPGLSSAAFFGDSDSACLPSCSRSTIPVNATLEGDYGFNLMDLEVVAKQYKCAHFLYSTLVRRAYIKQGATIPFYFTTTRDPPPGSVVRAMTIHTAPEKMGDSLVCCPKHVDINQKQGLIYPRYFIRPAPNDSSSKFCRESSLNSRLSIVTPFISLQEKTDAYAALYVFPCFTSDFPKNGQYVQIIFTLECDSQVLGRATMDIRVCASLGRDRDVDEKKKNRLPSNASNEEPVALPKSGRKRANPPQMVEVTKCSLPPKRVCHGLSRKKVSYTIETYPEVIPYIDVCVQMMEKVHSVPVSLDMPTSIMQQPSINGSMPSTSNTQQQPSTSNTQQPSTTELQFETLEGWLEHLGLKKYLKNLQKNGISDVAHVLAVTDEELKSWGMKTVSHRTKFLNAKNLISTLEIAAADQDNNSPDLFAQSPPLESTQPFPVEPVTVTRQNSLVLSQKSSSIRMDQRMDQSFEVLEITLTKNLSSSSSSSSSQ